MVFYYSKFQYGLGGRPWAKYTFGKSNYHKYTKHISKYMFWGWNILITIIGKYLFSIQGLKIQNGYQFGQKIRSRYQMD